MDETAKNAKRKYNTMLRRRNGFKAMFRSVSKYVLYRHARFGDQNVPSETANLSIAGVSDDVALDCARACATALGGALWPNADESFVLAPHPLMKAAAEYKDLLKTQEVKDYYREATAKARYPFNSEEAGFLIALGEHLDEQVTLGTSGIVLDEDEMNDVEPCSFRSISVETSVIDENAKKRVDSIAFERWMTARQAVEEYGEQAVSKTVADMARIPENEDTPIKIIQLIRPRKGGKVGEPKKNKPWSIIHFEEAEEHTVLEDGSDEMNAFVVRFRRRPDELYARSLAMDAMPMIRQLNVLKSGVDQALGKQLDPPSGFWSEMFGGVGSIDLSMGALVPLYDNGSIPQGRKPVEQFMTPGEPRVASERIDKNEERLIIKFLLDKLLDFPNKTRMTLGEAQLRNDFRNQALGNIFARQITELFYPIIMAVVKIYWRRGLFGLRPKRDAEIIAKARAQKKPIWVMPAVVEDFYEATGQLPFMPRFTSPAARAMQADALLGLEKLTNFVLTLVGGGMVEAADNYDTDMAVELYQHHVGAPPEVLRAAETRDEIREGRQQAQAQAANLEMQEQSSQIAKNAAKAAKDSAQAGPLGMTA